MTIIINGNICNNENHYVSALDRGFLYGDGVFTTMLVENGLVDNHECHFYRVINDAKILYLPPLTYEHIHESVDLIFKEGNVDPLKKYALRITYTRGVSTARGLDIPDKQEPTLIVSLTEITHDFTTPVKLCINYKYFRNEYSPLSFIKSLNYAENIIAKQLAKNAGADDAILLNTKGLVTCATSSNIFIREGDQWITPKYIDGILSGIERLVWLEDDNVSEDHISVDRLKKADEIKLTNSIWKRRSAILI
jgi:branched-chain amino acid aminotransferase